MSARRTATPRVGATIVWQALTGERVRGAVWSAGPHAGTVWATPQGQPAAVLVVTRGGVFREVGRA